MDKVQGTLPDIEQDNMQAWYDAFILDRRIRHVSAGSIRFYHQKLGPFVDWCGKQGLTGDFQITPHHLRLFLLWLEERGNNPGGTHAYYRSVRAFLNFFEKEVEPEGWKNPINKVSAPKVSDALFKPASAGKVSKLLETCDRSTFSSSRDKDIFLVLLDSGVRTGELLGIDLAELNLIDGSIQIRNGKGGKVRLALIGKKARKAVRFWLRKRPRHHSPLFTKKSGDKLAYEGLRAMLERRSFAAGVSGVRLHDFRRAFCLAQLQAGIPETTIARFTGHSNTQLIGLYTHQSTRNLIEVFHSVVDSEL